MQGGCRAGARQVQGRAGLGLKVNSRKLRLLASRSELKTLPVLGHGGGFENASETVGKLSKDCQESIGRRSEQHQETNVEGNLNNKQSDP